MSEIQSQPSLEQSATAGPAGPLKPNGRPPQQKRGAPLHQIYALPAPVRTFPLPTFYPNNPVSLIHIAYAWLSQVIRPPAAEPAVIHHGVWSEATTSVHITDEKSVRALWEQGFYGKGNLSRSEPNWLKREQVRRGLQEVHVSEILTVQRREERAQAKWERARLEQEAIRRTRLEEARQLEAREAAKSPIRLQPPIAAAPVGPLELLALPNSGSGSAVDSKQRGLAIGNIPLSSETILAHESNGTVPNGHSYEISPVAEGAQASPSPAASDSSEVRRRKSVRFSPKVESTTFQLSDPPSPHHLTAGSNNLAPTVTNGAVKSDVNGSISLGLGQHDHTGPETRDIINKEHLQLTPEEVFFLSFGMGALTVTDPLSGQKLSSTDLFTLFRQHSYFPPRNGPDDPDLEPDDSFLVHYAVYHHFRSLGWVPRPGIKFGVDWLLYTKGPVFDHAEFGVMIIPSYSDPWWKAIGKEGSAKSWQWMHSMVRVLSHVMKSLVLVYVDIPPPLKFDHGLESGLTEVLKLYKVREVMVKRWSSNRNR